MFMVQLIIRSKLSQSSDRDGFWILLPKISKSTRTYWLLRPSHLCSFELYLHLSVGIWGVKDEASWLSQQQSISTTLLCCASQPIDSVHGQPMLCRQFGWHFDSAAHLGCSRSNHFTPESRVSLDHPIQWLAAAFFFRVEVSCNLLEFIWTNLQDSSWQHCRSEDWNNCTAPWSVFLDAKIVVSAGGCWLN